MPAGSATVTPRPELPAARRRWWPAGPIEVALTLAPLARGRGDPTHVVEPGGAVWRTALTPNGPGTIRLDAAGAGDLLAAAWGPGARWLLDRAPALLGALDRWDGFDPRHPLLREARRRHPGLRLPRTGLVFEMLVPAVLEQKVTGVEARRSWRELLGRFGLPAPGPAPPRMRVIPPPWAWSRIPSWEWHRAGVDARRARTICRAARVAGRLEETARRPETVGVSTPGPATAGPATAGVELERRLRAVPGVGAWTAAEVRQRALGDPDAVSVGDCNVPALVGWALAGAAVDDEGMLRLLAPYRPHRQRVVRLIEVSGVHPPRFAPRTPVRDFRAL